jgi:hypothetical protein
MFNLLGLFLATAATIGTVCSGFSVGPAAARSMTRLFIQDSVAEMIDREYWREQHKNEFEIEWMKKNKEAILHSMKKAADGGNELRDNSGIGSLVMDVMDEPEQDVRQMVKDRRLAKANPQQYCADRCIATGYCEVYEDLYVDFVCGETIEG